MIAPDDRSRVAKFWGDSIASGQAFQLELRLWDSSVHEHRWYLARAVPVRNAEGEIVRWIGTSTDIHDRKTAEERLESEVESRTVDLKLSLSLLRRREEQLKKSLAEKDALMREIHHRVKNNLQIISSLLSMQAASADKEAVAPLRDSERRISSMAMIHEQLYSTDDMQTVEFAEHARRLSETLFPSLAETPQASCRLDLDSVSLTIHQAIPAALILNELLTNALKYGCPNKDDGEINVRLRVDADLVHMTVSDRGPGLPPYVDPSAPKTLGLQIVRVLVDQLEGELEVATQPGASFSIRFRRQETANLPAYLSLRKKKSAVAR